MPAGGAARWALVTDDGLRVDRLRTRWQQLIARTCPAAARSLVDDSFADVAARYGEPHRHYHTLAHVEAGLDAVAELAPRAGVPDTAAVELAMWLHDVIYDTRSADNEARSAGYARSLLTTLDAPGTLADDVERLILVTAGHIPRAADEGLLVDADLAVLHAQAADYDAYAAAVRREYAWVPDAEFRAARARVLTDLLGHRPLFHTPAGRAREPRARRNLEREIAALTA